MQHFSQLFINCAGNFAFELQREIVITKACNVKKIVENSNIMHLEKKRADRPANFFEKTILK